ncbi:MAG: malto-oligosyltrehalose synthase [Verrucomicrobia bacterium]|nr:MAG: malto-oligosyltrehalose synthase [Verrucomicrobiota bacterium]
MQQSLQVVLILLTSAATFKGRLMHIPCATYRLQFNQGFRFRDAAAIADYLRELGISDCYASPIFKAGPGSTHGYDVCDHTEPNPVLGGRAGFERFCDRLSEPGLGLVLDIVPNHMRAGCANPWWKDVLENGRQSPYAQFFDIDWRQEKEVRSPKSEVRSPNSEVRSPNSEVRSPKSEVRTTFNVQRSTFNVQSHLASGNFVDADDKIVLPVLEDEYWKVLGSGKLRLVYENGKFAIAYYDQRFPLRPESLPLSTSDPKRVLNEFNGTPGISASFERLDTLLNQQHYRLEYWREGQTRINYRRFFDVNELVSLRMESPEAFETVHGLLFELLQTGKVTGLRVDHPDGLRDPQQYFERLQDKWRQFGKQSSDQRSTIGAELGRRKVILKYGLKATQQGGYIVAEKILMLGEPLPQDWLIAGTTGYDFLNQVNGLFVDKANERVFGDIYGNFTGCSLDFPQIVYESKKRVLQTSFVAEVNALQRRLERIAANGPARRDLNAALLRAALEAVIAAFPVYRTYITERMRAVPAAQRGYILTAVREARSRSFGESPGSAGILLARSVSGNLGRKDGRAHRAASISTKGREQSNLLSAFDLIEEILLLKRSKAARCTPETLEFVMRFQQLTGPVMAKGLEDTAFYKYNRLISLNEVGGDPGSFGLSLKEFHEQNLERARNWPHSILASSTHDTKRGEDARARINVLSEIPDEWKSALTRWSRLNADKKIIVDGQPATDANDEYLLYQTLLGAWTEQCKEPDMIERVSAYAMKAIREAKVHTSWTDPNKSYEEATEQFVKQILSNAEPNSFLADFIPFQRRVSFFGALNSLSQTLLKMTAPGVPDFYQGAELWDFNLVDPDNRRPVDFELRRRLLDQIKSGVQAPSAPPSGNHVSRFTFHLSNLLGPGSPTAKLYLIWRVLNFRRDRRELFEQGDYVPILASGEKSEHVCAFARVLNGKVAIVIALRLFAGLTGGIQRLPFGKENWDDTAIHLPGGAARSRYRNILTDETIRTEGTSARARLRVAKVVANFPVALLEPIS